MPLYTYMCGPCEQDTTFLARVSELTAPKCPCCGHLMKRDFSAIRLRIITGCLDYTTSDINGTPVHVSTLRQERRLCAESGVRRASTDEVTVKLDRKLEPKETFQESFERKRQEMGVEL